MALSKHLDNGMPSCVKHWSNFEFRQSEYDHSLFIRKTSEGTTIILIYVDDMLITGDSLKIVEETKGKLKQAFKMKDLGELRYFLGIEFARSEHGIMMHQRYILRNSSQKLDSVVLSQQ